MSYNYLKTFVVKLWAMCSPPSSLSQVGAKFAHYFRALDINVLKNLEIFRHCEIHQISTSLFAEYSFSY